MRLIPAASLAASNGETLQQNASDALISASQGFAFQDDFRRPWQTSVLVMVCNELICLLQVIDVDPWTGYWSISPSVSPSVISLLADGSW